MDENSVKTLLKHIADTPEPACVVDIGAARRSGRRRLALRRVAAPALAVVAVAAIVTVPRALFSSDEERGGLPLSGPTLATPRMTRPPVPMPHSAPARFNPLVPYAAFGWLPSGFSEDAMANRNWSFDLGVSSSTDVVSRQALDPVAGHLLVLDVHARGACSPSAATTPPAGSCPDQAFDRSDPAPSVNGRPAYWQAYGSGIAWEYAPGAWATLTAALDPAADEPRSRRLAAEHGWVLSLPLGAHPTTVDQARTMIREGKAILPSAATKALLLKVARHVGYDQKTPLVFPFRLADPLPAGWQLTQASFTVSGNRLLSDGLTVGPAADTSALSIGTSPQFSACNFVAGQSSYVTRYGVNWEYRVMTDHIAKDIQMLCSMQKVNGLQVNVYLDMAPEEAGAPPLPGSIQLGGAFGVYEKLHLLGPDPANWTASPLG